MADMYAPLKANVHLLGTILGETINGELGEEFLNRIEAVRKLSKASRNGDDEARGQMLAMLAELPDEELVPFASSFNQFLNLANIAEQFHSISRDCDELVCVPDPVEQLLSRLLQGKAKLEPEQLQAELEKLEIDLVLTAHPTEITRRTLINKYANLIDCLSERENPQLSQREIKRNQLRMRQLVSQIWHTNEIRRERPTPVDEAKWGMATVEASLWHAIPEFLRQLSEQVQEHTGQLLPPHVAPVKFSSWMGGDRDGNPNVTATVSQEVLLRNRLTATRLYIEDIQRLTSELSMNRCSDSLREQVGDAREPYRVLLRQLSCKLNATRSYLIERLDGHHPETPRDQLIWQKTDLLAPLELLYDNLMESGMHLIANGQLLDTLRRVHCFGCTLVRVDIRQSSDRHADAIAELTRYLGLGDYNHWNEEEKQSFLLRELSSRRPLLPHQWQASAETQEVLDTCRMIADQGQEALGSYVISMAAAPSDVLAVALLLKECDCPFALPIVPLFETLSDLENAADAMRALFAIDWYLGYCRGRQQVMIGYSDSAKDAGVMAASWAQYRAQEDLVTVCQEADVALTLFHGRGGSMGRGGGPAHEAILSQPPGSVDSRLRVTEQGEMIRFKFGVPQVAVQSLALYTSAVLEATLLPPPAPKQEWRAMMDEIAANSVEAYREIVWHDEDFVPYFRAATPEQELAALPLGSRPAKRRADGGVESLRAIPWIFAWTQNRLMLPAWLGAGEALQKAVEDGHRALLQEMFQQWPVFRTRLSMLEMVYAKSEPNLARYYEQILVPDNLHHLGAALRQRLQTGIDCVLDLTQEQSLMDLTPWSKESVALRHPYIDPLNFLQAELLRRCRGTSNDDLQQALMITIAGIAAGLRNTG
ncbi:phosphoenolpyruvate carboxylase [Ferrimonas marina]|uniref:Phosphoenolpyruvate carboxylase n=1 Tax=Ferrimonas marina TaxID=299255 RepID=A0A1M5XHC2_9GAMM|nr:phosphoenolpyruvate carboxylase [Ferrimonas marina]SHH99149.1 Phosphoenolpyruvate carboxylase, type 1 [Ferrimonas marina]